MSLFNRNRQHTKRSCLGNAVVAFVLGVFMVGCMFVKESITSQETEGFLVSAGIMAAVGLYWIYRWYKFDDQDFNDPFHMKH